MCVLAKCGLLEYATWYKFFKNLRLRILRSKIYKLAPRIATTKNKLDHCERLKLLFCLLTFDEDPGKTHKLVLIDLLSIQ